MYAAYGPLLTVLWDTLAWDVHLDGHGFWTPTVAAFDVRARSLRSLRARELRSHERASALGIAGIRSLT